MTAWFLRARFDDKAPFQPVWGGPRYVQGNDLSDAGPLEVILRTSFGGVAFAIFLVVCWRLFLKRLWLRGDDPPSVERGRGLAAIFH